MPRCRKRSFRLGTMVFLLFWGYAAASFGAFSAFVFSCHRDLPPMSEIEPRPNLTSFIYAADGQLLAELHGEEHRIPVKLDMIPPHLQEAFVAVEDARFWKHRGIDLRAVARAALVNLRERKITQGASTITQQLARTAFISRPSRTFKRKIQEVLLAIQLERKYTKQEILEFYLNQINFGRGAHGVQAASLLYFGKPVNELNLAEAAMLAGIARSPSTYSPHLRPAAARERQQKVLDVMVAEGFLTPEQAAEAKNVPVVIVPPQPKRDKATYFVDFVLEKLLKTYGADFVYNKGGLKVYTTIDLEMQRIAEEAFAAVLDPDWPLTNVDEEGITQPQAAMVALEVGTGHIKAMIGGRGQQAGMLLFNRAAHACRQPGSAFKPVIAYAVALDMGGTAASIIDDAPIQYRQSSGEMWAPENYDLRFRGLTPFREGLKWSINVMAVRLLDRIGVRTGIACATKMGVSTLVTSGAKNDLGLATALGGLTTGVTVLELTNAYATFANKGVYVEPVAILKVVDRNGNVLEEANPVSRQAVKPETAYIMTDMLKDVILGGTGRAADIGRPAAGKTGTTSDDKDAWFLGYTPELAAGIWMGYDIQKRMGQVWGGTYPARIWKYFMERALAGRPATDFRPPPTIRKGIPVCTKSGLLPGPHCPRSSIREEVFAMGTIPTKTCDVHVLLEVCADTNLLSTEHCPRKVRKVFLQRPEPYTPAEDGRVPLDASLEAPRTTCALHSPGPAD